MDEITIKRSEYDELKMAVAKVTELAAKVSTLETEVAKVAKLEGDVEALEIAKKAAEDALATKTAELATLTEAALQATLSGDRTNKLGTAFLEKLPETVKTKLTEQAKSLSDEDWAGRLEELSALTGVKSDEGGAAPAAGSLTADETARTQFGGTTSATTTSKAATSAVLGGLMRQVRPRPSQPAAK